MSKLTDQFAPCGERTMIKKTPRSVTFAAMKISQPIGDFYVGAMRAKDLVEIAWFDIRQLHRGQENVDSYLGIQRRLNEARVKELSQYVNTVDSTFPTAVILAVDEVCASASPLQCSPST